jgi:two-component system, NtrC family, sensor histidine kinase HydH
MRKRDWRRRDHNSWTANLEDAGIRSILAFVFRDHSLWLLGLWVDADPGVCHDVPIMAAWNLTRWRSGTELTRQFAILSFFVIGLIILALSMMISYALRKDLLEREWVITADYIRTGILYHLIPSDLAVPGTKTAQEHFEALYQQTVTMPEIFRVKIYDSAMAVVWSDEPRLIGQRFPDNPHLARALTGRTTVNLQTGDAKAENLYERNEFARVVEVYVPIVFPGASRVAGAVEAYKLPNQVFASIRKGQLAVVGTALAGGALLYVSLFWIVRRAARRIEEQHHALEEGTQELSSANQELRAVQAQLLESERMAAIGEVVTAVAHGIRNPLANIRASAQVASLDYQDGGGSGLVRENLATIMAEVDRLEGRLKELLQFVRPADQTTGPLNLNAVVAGALDMMAGRIAKANLRLETQLAPQLPQILGNSMLLEQVFLSLIGNAIEAIPDGGGTITVRTGILEQNAEAGRQRAASDARQGRLPSADGPPPSVFVEVQDTGVGIPPDLLAKIFEPFRTTKAQGTGLGLAIAKKFTEVHGGTLAVNSRPAEGTTFRVMLPAQQET